MSLAIALGCALAAAVAVSETSSARVVAEVKAADAAWAEAAASKSAERVVEFYDDKGVFIGQDVTDHVKVAISDQSSTGGAPRSTG